MGKITGLKREYIQVKRKADGVLTFGGDQNFFGASLASKADQRKQQSGCGVVAFADLLLYLGGKGAEYLIPENKSYVNRTLSEEEYKEYYNAVHSMIGGIPFKGGVSGLKLWFQFNRLAARADWRLRAQWGFSGKKLNDRMEEMLSKDIPVICCIPMTLLKKEKKDTLWLYYEDGSKAVCTKAHYVTITGIKEKQNEVFYQISSWGKKYYMSRNEYDAFMKTHFMGTLLGNILYIRSRKAKAF